MKTHLHTFVYSTRPESELPLAIVALMAMAAWGVLGFVLGRYL